MSAEALLPHLYPLIGARYSGNVVYEAPKVAVSGFFRTFAVAGGKRLPLPIN